MRLLSHHADRSCPNGRRLRPVPQLRSDRHLPGVSRTSVGPAPCFRAGAATSFTTELESSPTSDESNSSGPQSAFHGTGAATKKTSRPASSHDLPRWSAKSDALVPACRPWRIPRGSPWRQPAKSFPPHSWLPCAPKYGNGACPGHDGWDGWGFAARQGCVSCTPVPFDTTVGGCNRATVEPWQFRRHACISAPIRAQHSKPPRTTGNQLHPSCLRRSFSPRIPRPRGFPSEGLLARYLPGPGWKR